LFPTKKIGFCLVQKAVMPKKTVFAAPNLKDCLPSLPLKSKKENKVSSRIC
jgi:hypothetical protein